VSTTSIFVEQVFSGLLVLLVAVLVAGQDPRPWLANTSLAGSAFVLGAAYLIGIVYDRVSDTLLEHLDCHHRIRFCVKKGKLAPARDPFPDRRAVYENSAASEYADYLRSRIRLTRSLTTILPALSTAFLLCRLGVSWSLGTVLLTGVYAIAFLSKITGPEPHKTYQLTEGTTYELYEAKFLNHSVPWLLFRHEPLTWLALVLAAGGVVLAACGSDYRLLWVPPAGLVLTALCGWTWWRITQTYHAHLKSFDRAKEEAVSC
jgi:hypothetical protein